MRAVCPGLSLDSPFPENTGAQHGGYFVQPHDAYCQTDWGSKMLGSFPKVTQLPREASPGLCPSGSMLSTWWIETRLRQGPGRNSGGVVCGP